MNPRFLSACLSVVLLWAAVPNRGQAQAAFREAPSLPAAGEYLKGRADWWLTWPRAKKDQGTVCMSCHTTAPYLLAQSVLKFEPGKAGEEPWERMLKSV